MREELIFPQVDLQNLNKVIELIDSIAENPGDCGALLEQLSGLTGKTHDAMEFAEYWGWTDVESLAKAVLTPEPPCVRDLSQKEIEEIVGMVKESFIMCDDAKGEYYVELLHRSLALPNVMDIIMSERDVTKAAEKIVCAAKSSVICL